MTDIKSEQEAFAEGFAGVGLGELEAMPDAELAEWQAGWKVGTTKHILAEKEWAGRLAMRQLREQFKLEEQLARMNRWWGLAASLVGVVGHACRRMAWGRPGKPVEFRWWLKGFRCTRGKHRTVHFTRREPQCGAAAFKARQQQMTAATYRPAAGGLTPPSSGRPKGRFAPFVPPLMSNVR